MDGTRRLSKKERKALKRKIAADHVSNNPSATGGGNVGRKKPKKQCKNKEKITKHAQQVPTTSSFSPAAQAVLASFAGSSKDGLNTSPGASVASMRGDGVAVQRQGSLSDWLNPSHQHFDAALKGQWKSFTKRERAAIVARDKEVLTTATARAQAEGERVARSYPFEPDPDDHCESPLEAYRDIAPLLHQLATRLSRRPSELRIYDPFYCAGTCVKHLAAVGFTSVYNRCEDFYAVRRAGEIPAHDIVVTNPPYSGEHPERLLRWCRENGKPFALLMPNYFIAKPYYRDALSVTRTAAGARVQTHGSAASVAYLVPRRRYNYWTPRGLRARAQVQAHHVSSDGAYRTSPFVSFWYVDLHPVLPQRALFKWWSENGGRRRLDRADMRAAGASKSAGSDKKVSDGASEGLGPSSCDTVLCTEAELPAGVRP